MKFIAEDNESFQMLLVEMSIILEKQLSAYRKLKVQIINKIRLTRDSMDWNPKCIGIHHLHKPAMETKLRK